jgi:hypothetical protein
VWCPVVLLLGCDAAASTSGRKATKDSFFMATDKGLLSIMQQQDLGCFVSMLQLQRGPRVGIDGFVMQLIMQAATSTGSIKFYVGKCLFTFSKQCWGLKGLHAVLSAAWLA